MPSQASAEPTRDVVRRLSPILCVFLALVVVSPWPYGSAGLREVRTITLVGLLASIATCLFKAWRRERIVLVSAFWPVLGGLALATVQLLPLPEGLHRLVAPGSAAVWHPQDPVVAEVLGTDRRPISVDPAGTRQALGFLSAVATLGFLSLPSLAHRRPRAVAVVVVTLGGLLAALFGIVSHLWFGNRLFGQLVVPTVAPFGSFVSKNHFAGYTEMAALLALGLGVGLAEEASRGSSLLSWTESRRAGRVLAALGAAAAMGFAVLVCQSRGGFLALGAGLLAFALLRGSRGGGGRKRQLLLATAALLVAGLATFLVLPGPSQQRLLGLARAGEDTASVFRLGVWADSVRTAKESPLLGWGLGAFAEALPAHKSAFGELRVEHAENEYLELLVEGGLAGLGLLILGLVYWGHGLTRALGQDERRRAFRATAAGAAAGTIALCVHGLVDFNLRVPSNALLFALLATVAVSQRVRLPPASPSLPGLGLALVLGVVLLIARPLSPPAARPDLGSLRDRSGPSLRANQRELGLRDYLRQRPTDAEAWVLLGWLRAAGGAPEAGRALIRHGGRLDPQRRELLERAATQALSAGGDR